MLYKFKYMNKDSEREIDNTSFKDDKIIYKEVLEFYKDIMMVEKGKQERLIFELIINYIYAFLNDSGLLNCEIITNDNQLSYYITEFLGEEKLSEQDYIFIDELLIFISFTIFIKTSSDKEIREIC